MNNNSRYTYNSAWIALVVIMVMTMGSCKRLTALEKTTDYEYRYEAAKAYFVEGSYSKAASHLGNLIATFKGTQYGEESLFLLAQSELELKSYETAANYFKKYYQTYPHGVYVEQARFNSAWAMYKQIPDVRLDQSSTWDALKEFQDFLDYHPTSRSRALAQEYIGEMQNMLVEKEFLAAKLYYDLGSYMNNCAYGGSNYEACIVTSENALKDYPYASAERRESFAIMILRCRYDLAKSSVTEKRPERFRETIDEYYSFVNDYPESVHLKEAARILKNSQAYIKNQNIDIRDLD